MNIKLGVSESLANQQITIRTDSEKARELHSKGVPFSRLGTGRRWGFWKIFFEIFIMKPDLLQRLELLLLP
jgi:hypothetical protein